MVHSANKVELFDTNQLPNKKLLIAYSGGADSTALLHFCAHQDSWQGRIRAIHINHQLQAESDSWEYHCQQQCQQWRIPLLTERVTLSSSSENAARQARLAIFGQHINSDEIILTAHHEHDQAETVLFRLFRGTGLRGMCGIQQQTIIEGHTYIKPLLQTTKSDILNYLKHNQINWIEDPSNTLNHYSRNRIRNQILPIIEQQFKNAIPQMALTARQLTKSLDLLNQLIPDTNPLSVNDWQINSTFLYHWLHQHQQAHFTEKQLTTFCRSIEQADISKLPQLESKNIRLLYWQKHLYLLTKEQATQTLNCSWHKDIDLKHAGYITFTTDLPIDTLTIHFNLKGQKIHLPNHKHHKSIKKLHQQAGTPPWEKSVTPYLFSDDKLLAVGNWVSQRLTDLLNSHSCQYRWHKPQQIL